MDSGKVMSLISELEASIKELKLACNEEESGEYETEDSSEESMGDTSSTPSVASAPSGDRTAKLSAAISAVKKGMSK